MLLIEHRATLLQGRSGLQQSGYKAQALSGRGLVEKARGGTRWLAVLIMKDWVVSDLMPQHFVGVAGADLKFETVVSRDLAW